MGKGDFFGELALIYDDPRAATVTTDTAVKCISLGRRDINELFGEDL